MAVRPSALAAVSGALLCAVLTAAGPAAAAPADRLTVSPTAALGQGGAVTLSGTYRCTDAGAVFLTSNLRTGGVQQSIGSVRAVCDGAEHAWSSQDTPRYLTLNGGGPAEAEVSLVRLDISGGLPLPHLLVVQRQNVTLAPAAH